MRPSFLIIDDIDDDTPLSMRSLAMGYSLRKSYSPWNKFKLPRPIYKRDHRRHQMIRRKVAQFARTKMKRIVAIDWALPGSDKLIRGQLMLSEPLSINTLSLDGSSNQIISGPEFQGSNDG